MLSYLRFLLSSQCRPLYRPVHPCYHVQFYSPVIKTCEVKPLFWGMLPVRLFDYLGQYLHHCEIPRPLILLSDQSFSMVNTAIPLSQSCHGKGQGLRCMFPMVEVFWSCPQARNATTTHSLSALWQNQCHFAVFYQLSLSEMTWHPLLRYILEYQSCQSIWGRTLSHCSSYRRTPWLRSARYDRNRLKLYPDSDRSHTLYPLSPCCLNRLFPAQQVPTHCGTNLRRLPSMLTAFHHRCHWTHG